MFNYRVTLPGTVPVMYVIVTNVADKVTFRRTVPIMRWNQSATTAENKVPNRQAPGYLAIRH